MRERLDLARVDVERDDAVALLGEGHGERQADVSEAHDPDRHTAASVDAGAVVPRRSNGTGSHYHGAADVDQADPPAPDRRRATPAALPRARVVGIDLAVTDYGATMDWIDEVIRRDGRVCLTAAAVNLVMTAREDPATMAAVQRAVAVPDGDAARVGAARARPARARPASTART